jgi:uncharacterized protein YdeI (YjbR/CyaY-like superfamily)
MKVVQTLHVADRKEWRDWLKKNYKIEKEIWLVYYKKDSGKPRILYNDAVEEALCFGWIDSTVKRLDSERFAQKFSPRKPGSPYSQANKERLARLVENGKVLKPIRDTLGDFSIENVQIPKDIRSAIKSNRLAWKNFQKFSQPYIRIRIAFIEGARNRPQEYEKRLRYFIKMTEKNKQFGFGGIEKYY